MALPEATVWETKTEPETRPDHLNVVPDQTRQRGGFLVEVDDIEQTEQGTLSRVGRLASRLTEGWHSIRHPNHEPRFVQAVENPTPIAARGRVYRVVEIEPREKFDGRHFWIYPPYMVRNTTGVGKDFLEHLAHTFPGSKISAVETEGFGSDRPPARKLWPVPFLSSGFNFDKMAYARAELQDESAFVETGDNLIKVGGSMGGAIAGSEVQFRPEDTYVLYAPAGLEAQTMLALGRHFALPETIGLFGHITRTPPEYLFPYLKTLLDTGAPNLSLNSMLMGVRLAVLLSEGPLRKLAEQSMDEKDVRVIAGSSDFVACWRTWLTEVFEKISHPAKSRLIVKDNVDHMVLTRSHKVAADVSDALDGVHDNILTFYRN